MYTTILDQHLRTPDENPCRDGIPLEESLPPFLSFSFLFPLFPSLMCTNPPQNRFRGAISSVQELQPIRAPNQAKFLLNHVLLLFDAANQNHHSRFSIFKYLKRVQKSQQTCIRTETGRYTNERFHSHLDFQLPT
jgi:hypothetical protein